MDELGATLHDGVHHRQRQAVRVQFHLFMRINGCRVISFICRHFGGPAVPRNADTRIQFQQTVPTNTRIIRFIFLFNFLFLTGVVAPLANIKYLCGFSMQRVKKRGKGW